MEIKEVIIKAKEAMKHSYSPYSEFKVGAALVTKNGKIYIGCNIENHGIMSICAERVAFTKALSEGEREFEYLVVCGGRDENQLEFTTPCGYCRQFISEFVNPDFTIYTINDKGEIKKFTIKELLPEGFNLD